MELRDYLRAIRRRWFIVALCVGLALLGGVATSSVAESIEPVPTATNYEATTLLLDIDQGANTNTLVSSLSSLDTAARLVSVGEVPVRVAKEVGFEGEPAELAAAVTATAEPKTNMLSIVANGRDPEDAERLADTFAKHLVGYIDDLTRTSLEETSEAVAEQIEVLEGDLRDIEDGSGGAPEEVVASERQALISQIATLSQTRRQLESGQPPKSGLIVIQPAAAVASAGTQSFPIQAPRSFAARALIGGVLGLLIGIAIVLLLDRYDTRIWTKQNAEQLFRLPVLVEIPELRKNRRGFVFSAVGLALIVAAAAMAVARPVSAWAIIAGVLGAQALVLFGLAIRSFRRRHSSEDPIAPATATNQAFVDTFRMLAVDMVLGPWSRGRDDDKVGVDADGASENGEALVVAPSHAPAAQPADAAPVPPRPPLAPRSILVTSAGPGEGKTTVVANLAAAFAELGKRVVVLSCDFHHPRIHDAFGVPESEGLAEALRSNNSGPILNGHVVPTSLGNVSVVPSGLQLERPGELLGSARMKAVLAEAGSRADIVLIDTSPLLTAGEASLLLPDVDGVVVVARAGQTTAELAIRTSQYLGRLGRDAGVVVNASMDASPPPIYRREPGFFSHMRAGK